jgi:hypothetical protein
MRIRAVLSCLPTVVLPGSLFAADSSAAMLYTNGPAWLNGSNVPKTSAIRKKKRDRNMGGAVPAAGGGILDSPPAIYTGLAAIGVFTGWALMQGDDPMSPK